MFVRNEAFQYICFMSTGAGGAKKQYANSFQALTTILKNEGVVGIYTG